MGDFIVIFLSNCLTVISLFLNEIAPIGSRPINEYRPRSSNCIEESSQTEPKLSAIFANEVCKLTDLEVSVILISVFIGESKAKTAIIIVKYIQR